MSKKSPQHRPQETLPAVFCYILFFQENHKDIRHEREICTLEASRFNKGRQSSH